MPDYPFRGSNFRCKTCDHILGHCNSKTRRYDAVCHCGCTDWIPCDNLEYLEWCEERKRLWEMKKLLTI